MKLKGTNASSKKTIDLIRKTFAELISENKEIQSITVTELVRRANMTRGAFYSHYDNIYQVASEFEEEILEQVIDNDITINTKKDMYAYFDKIFKYLKDNETIYSKLLASNDTMIYMKRLNRKICNSLSQNLTNKSHNLDIIFFTDGTIDLIVKSFKKEIDENLNQVCEYVKKMAEYMFF